MERDLKECQQEHERELQAVENMHARQVTRLEHQLAEDRDTARREMQREKAEAQSREAALVDKALQAERSGAEQLR